MAQAHSPVNADNGGRKRILAIIAVFAALLLSFGQARAATYYVATTGNDSSNGTSEATAWRTIQKGADVAKAGDTVIVLPGTYPGSISQKNDGTASGRITFISKDFYDKTGRWGAKIVGTSANVVFSVIGDFVDVIGFDVTASNDPCCGIVLYGSNTRAMYNHVHDLKVTNCGSNGGSGIGAVNYSSSTKEIIGNVVHHIGTPTCTGGHPNGVHGIYPGVPNVKVLNNISYSNLWGGIHLWHAAIDNTVAYNLVFNNGGPGIIFGCGDKPNVQCRNIQIYNNIVMNNGGVTGAIREYGNNAVGSNKVFNNITYGNKNDAVSIVDGAVLSGNLIGVNPQLTAFNPAGSSNITDYYPAPGSPAIDAASNACAGCNINSDILLGARPFGAGSDIGPLEAGSIPGAVPPPIAGGGGTTGGTCPPGTVPGPGSGTGGALGGGVTAPLPTGSATVGIPLPPQGGKTWYVATTGSDSNPGTEAAPFRTIVKASNAMAAGDTVLIRAGTYAEGLTHGLGGFVFKNGTSWSAMTRFAAYPGEQVVIKPPRGWMGTVNGGATFALWFSRNTQFIEIRGLVIDGTNSTRPGTSSTTGPVKFDGSYTQNLWAKNNRLIASEIRYGGGIGGGGGNEIIGNWVHHSQVYGIYPQFDNGLLENNLFEDNDGYGLHLFVQDHQINGWVVRNNIFRRNGGNYRPKYDGRGIRNNVVRNGELRPLPGVILTRGSHQFYNNLVYDNPYGGVTVGLGARNMFVANNTVYGNGRHGIKINSSYNGSQNTKIINNISYGNNGPQIEDTGTNTTLQNNLTSDPNFVNAAGRDFHLNAGSAAIDKGVTLPQVPNDFYYGTRPFGSAYDIGAIEQGAPPGQSPSPPIAGGGATGGGGVTCVPAPPVCPPGTVPSTTGGGPSSVDPPPATGPITPPPPGAGNTYWVATNGNNSNPGTATAPWKTIAYAVSKMNAGDTTYVRGGTYNEKYILFNKSGAPGAPIRLLNAPGEKPKIDFGLIGGVSGQPVNRIEINAPGITPIGHITIEGFEISRAWDGLKYHDAHDIVFRRNWVHHSINQGILGNGKRMFFDRNVINHNGNFERCARGDLTKIGTSVCNQAHGMYLTGRDYIITNNLIYDSSAFGIQVAGYVHCPQGGCDQYNKVFADASYGGADNFFIANNTIAYNNYRGAIVLWQRSTTNSKIINNIFYENIPKYRRGGSATTQGVSIGPNTGGGHFISNNICYSTLGDHCITPGMQAKYSGSGNITVNPNFVSAGPTLPFAGIADFHLRPGSPAIDTGTTLPQVPRDHEGGPRPFGPAYDVGAYEYGAPPDPEAPAPVITWPPTGGTAGGGGVTCVPVDPCGAGAAPPVTPPVVTGATTTPTGTGKNYYMSPSGNDSNPGTEAAPWRTLDRLQQAQSILRPGDTVWFRGGDYVVDNNSRAYYSWRAEGTAANPIIYRNYAGEVPVIVLDRTVPKADAGTFIFIRSHIIIDGLNFRQTEASRSKSQAPNGDIIRNSGVGATALATWADGVTIRNCSIQGFVLGIFYEGSNILVENCKVFGTISHAFYIAGRAGTWRYNETDGSRGYPNQQGIQIQYQTSIGNKIYGNLMKNGRASGVVFSGSVANNEVFNNIIVNGGSKPDGSFGYALSFWCEKDHGGSRPPARALGGNKFYNNTIIGKTNSGLIADRTGTAAGGPYCHAMNGGRPLAENVEIYNNIFYPSSPPALTLMPISSVRNNIFYNIKGAAPPGNMLVNPMLANPNGTMAADAMLQAGSPAIDAAIDPGPDLDYQGGTRPVGPRKDIGAFEYGAPPGPLGGPLGSAAPPPPAGCPVTPPPPHVIEEGVYLCPP